MDLGQNIKNDHIGTECGFNLFNIINQKLLEQKEVYINPVDPDKKGTRYSYAANQNGSLLLHQPSISIYAGTGVSHSWLWFVDIIDRFGFESVNIVTEVEIINGGLIHSDTLLVSGGETFAIANGLGVKGRVQIDRFIKNGGLYLGTCAGACLMMNSTTEESLGLFDFVKVKIANIVQEIPEQIIPSNKFSTPYGCAWVFHPVREEILLNFCDKSPFFPKGDCVAPLYGGPPMEESEDAVSIARYKAFTPGTEFLTDSKTAEHILIGKTAVCRKISGEGSIILCGPHLEHPGYTKANTIIADAIFENTAGKKLLYKDKKTEETNKSPFTIKDLKRETSNIRIVASALEYYPVSWKIGRKYYEPEKIRLYAETIWKFIIQLERLKVFHLYLNDEDTEKLGKTVHLLKNATKIIRKLKKTLDDNENSNDLAVMLFNDLRILSVDFFSIYFRCKRRVKESDNNYL